MWSLVDLGPCLEDLVDLHAKWLCHLIKQERGYEVPHISKSEGKREREREREIFEMRILWGGAPLGFVYS